MRRLLCLLSVLWLAACDEPQARAPFAQSRIPPSLPLRALPPEGWTWGLIQVGRAPPARYGVAAPPVVPRGQVLILPGYGEPAEAWFEAADVLVARGYGVWVLESVGQGGSGRYTLPRDVGDAPDFAPDLRAMSAMRGVMGRAPDLVIAQGEAAPLLVAALRRGLAARGAILSAPLLSPSLDGPYATETLQAAPWLEMAQLGWLRALGQPGWRRRDPLPAGRAGVIQAWQTANPDLRMGGPSWGWIAAFQAQTDELKAGSLGAVHTPVLILESNRPSADAAALCRRLPHCTLAPIADGRSSLHLESDRAFMQWIDAVTAFIDQTKPQS